MDRLVTRVRIAQLFNPSRPRRSGLPPRRTVFIAYRFNVPSSQAFRKNLERDALGFTNSRNLGFVDGHVGGGEDWPRRIRERIERCWFGVADLTGPSREVTFETGLLSGAGKRVIPAVEASSWRGRLPRWFTARQILCFESEPAYQDLLEQVVALANARLPSEPVLSPDPSLALVLLPAGSSWTVSQIEALWSQESLQPPIIISDVLEVQSVDRLRALCRASVVFWTPEDAGLNLLGNYVAGHVVARPRAGASGWIDRRVYVLSDSAAEVCASVSDAALRADDVIRSRPSSELPMLVNDFRVRYFRWLQGVKHRLPTELGEEI